MELETTGDAADGGTVTRRRAIKIGSAVGVTGLVGGLGLQLAGQASALADTVFSAANASITTADGNIDAVNIQPSGSVTWQNMTTLPQSAFFEIVVANNASFVNDDTTSDNAATITEEQDITNQERSASENFTLTQYDLLADSSYDSGDLLGISLIGDGTAPFTASDFEAETEGTTEETTVNLQLTVGLYEEADLLTSLESATPLIEATDSTQFIVSVTHAEDELTFDIVAQTSVESGTEV